MEKSAVYNLYIRKVQMEQSIEQLKNEVNRNNKIVEILNRASDKEKESLELKKFTDAINDQVNNYNEQIEKMQKMVDLNNEVISIYESDKDKFEEIINKLLLSFGFEEAENSKNS